MKYFAAAFCGVLLLLTGCRSDIYYQERAVERARRFLLENARDLTPEELAYVRVNDPVLLHGDVLVNAGGAELSTDLHQICVTWIIPGRKEYYMVYGVSTGRMAFWHPERLLRRRYLTMGVPWVNAVKSVEQYAKDNLYESLTSEEMNQIRFEHPWVMRTDFDLNLKTAGLLSKSGKKPKGEQYSLAWKFSGRSLVFAGFTPPWKSGWKIAFAAFVSEAELKKSTVKVIASPDDLQSVILNDDEDLSEKNAAPTPEKQEKRK